MKKLAFVSCLLLAGCTDADWDHALNYAHLGGPSDETAQTTAAQEAPAPPPRSVAPQAAPATVATAPAAENDFCRGVATQDATSNGFDPATQQRVFAQSYAQCVVLYSR
jgi:hypothetical protein